LLYELDSYPVEIYWMNLLCQDFWKLSYCSHSDRHSRNYFPLCFAGGQKSQPFTVLWNLSLTVDISVCERHWAILLQMLWRAWPQVYSVSQKSSPPPKKKTFCSIFNFSLRLSIFPWSFAFCQFVASLYPHIFTSFGRFILNKTASSQIPLTSSLMMSDPNSPNRNPLAYQVWGQCWSLITSCNRSQKQFPEFKNVF